MDVGQSTRTRARPGTFRSLRVRNYRLYALAGLVSVTGSWMQLVAQSWLVLRLTGSTAVLGVSVALQALPAALLGLVGGVVADRLPRRRLLVATQVSWIAVTLVLAILVATDRIAVWMLLLASLLGGLISAVEGPASAAFGPELVGPDDLANAIALGGAISSVGRVLGMAIAGVAIAAAGPAFVFFANAVSFAPVIAALAWMRTSELRPVRRAPRARGQIREGLRHVAGSPLLLTVTLLACALSLFGRNYQVTMAAMADGPLHAGAGGYGTASTAFAVGAVAGALLAARVRRPGPAVLLVAGAATGALQIAAGLAPGLPQFVVVVVPIAAGAVVIDTMTSALTQLGTDDSLRARVAAVLGLAGVGGAAAGGLLLGWLADVGGPRAALVLGGAAVMGSVAAGAASLLERPPSRTREPIAVEA